MSRGCVAALVTTGILLMIGLTAAVALVLALNPGKQCSGSQAIDCQPEFENYGKPARKPNAKC